MIVVAIAGILLPYRQKELWKSSPGSGTIAGIPTITIVSIISIPLLLVMEWALWTDVNSGTSLKGQPAMLAFTLSVFVVGYPVYYIIRAIQRKRGINIDLAYKEIPPE
jgi:hypothetical protein